MSLDIENLTVSYGGTVAVDGVDLHVSRGERFAVMGPSGSGKSSLIRAVAGVVPSRGAIIVDGADVSDVPTHERPIGLMFQDYALFPHMTVADNVGYGLKMAGIDKDRRGVLVAGMLARVGLGDFAGRSVQGLSGGEQQRVALARTLAPEPLLVMLDEPLGSLDAALREALLLHMRSVVEDLGTTTIYVTHDRGEAFAFADRVGILIDGRMAAVDTPEGLWTNPGTVSVARLIGHQTVMDGTDVGLEGWIAVPPGAVRLDPKGTHTGTVVDSTFTDGTFQTTVRVGNSDVRVTTPSRMASGTGVSLTIDETAIIRVTDDRQLGSGI